MANNKDITVLMPMYNEEESIKNTLEKWVLTLEKLNLNWKIEIYNDGSKDNSRNIIEKMSEENPNIIIHSRENKGFSKTLYEAYDKVSDTEYIFHTDSDTEINPEDFEMLWNERNNADLITGRRMNRKQTLMRKIATKFAAFYIALLFNGCRIQINDTNIPFKLMKLSLLKEIIKTFDDTNPYPDLFVCAYCCKKKLKIKEVPVEHDNSERKSWLDNIPKLIKSEFDSVRTLLMYRFRLK